MFNHNYKPEPVFTGNGPDFYGVELEYECTDGREIALPAAFYAKRDGSLSYGVEFVSHPASIETWAGFDWSAMCQRIVDAGMFVEMSCGLHVHISRKALTPEQWMKVGYFIHSNPELLEVYGRRPPNSYCKVEPKVLDSEILFETDRYQAINFTNAHTVELRFFASTLEDHEIEATLIFAKALVLFAKMISMEDIMSPSKALLVFSNAFEEAGTIWYLAVRTPLTGFHTEVITSVNGEGVSALPLEGSPG